MTLNADFMIRYLGPVSTEPFYQQFSLYELTVVSLGSWFYAPLNEQSKQTQKPLVRAFFTIELLDWLTMWREVA